MKQTLSLDILVKEGVLTSEACERLNDQWVNTIDELYARVKACAQDSSREAVAKELGIKTESLQGFLTYLEAYVSPQIVHAKPLREYPLGLKIGNKKES